MFSRRTLVATLALLLLGLPLAASGQVTQADYVRAASLSSNYSGLVPGIVGGLTWLDDGRFWYRTTVKGGHTFVLVDPVKAVKVPAFDHRRLAEELSRGLSRTIGAETLPFTSFTFTGATGIAFSVDDQRWRCSLSDYRCERDASGAAAGGGRGRGPAGRGPQAGGGARGVRSPDGRAVAEIREHNIYVRPTADPDGGVAVTTSGTAERPFVASSIAWSPNSMRIAAYRTTPGERRMVRYVQSSPPDQIQPKTFEIQYAKPGDRLDRPEPVLVDVASQRETPVDLALVPHPYAMSRPVWRRDSRAFTFEYNERGHQVFRVVEVDGYSGKARALVDERSDTFIHYSGRRFRHDLDDGAAIIWLSERSGWAHLYMYDGATGRVKHPITSGNWLVRSVLHVDEAAKQIYFSAGAVHVDQNPYFVHYYRVNFDGTELTALTREVGDHSVTLSPNGAFYVDTWSRVDVAPITQLRRTRDGSVVLELERGDLTALKAVGWKPPEVFVAKGRDGTTDIYGVIFRPTNFVAGRKYPVVESIYAGPHDSFVPKNFSAHYGMQSLAELGFLVVQIDGMGTANRSKSFHDVAWRNIGDAGFPDRIRWHQAAAKRYPEYDITRLGIYGGSAGGQNSTGALLFHPDFYKAAVSFAGCHDNRMDKIWWNEQWMGIVGPHYDASSNVVHAKNLKGKLLLIVPELDTNVDPSSTMQVANALIKANKQFEMLVMPGEEHGGGRRGPSAPYGDRTMWDFFVRHLRHEQPPDWNTFVSAGTTPTGTAMPRGTAAASTFGETWAQILANWGGH